MSWKPKLLPVAPNARIQVCSSAMSFRRDSMYVRFRWYGFLKNLRFFDAFLILFLREMGLSFLQIGVLYSIREISANLLELPTGILADSFGRRHAMMASFAAYVASFLLFYSFPLFWVYALAMILFAIGETFRSGTHKAMILEYLRLKGWEDHKIAYYGRTRAASQLGSSVASLVAGALVFYSGSFRIAFLASTVPYVLGLFLFATYPPELDGTRLERQGRLWRTLRETVAETVHSLLGSLRNPELWRSLFSSAGFAAVFRSTKDYLQPILQTQAVMLPVLVSLSLEQRTAILVAGIYAGIHALASLASSRAQSVCARLRSPAQAVYVSYLLGLALLCVAGASAWLRLPWLAIVCFVFVYMLQNGRRPILVGYLSDLFAHQSMASGLSAENQLRTFLAALVAPLLGWIADAWGVGPAILVVSTVALILSPLVRTRRTQTLEP